MSATCSATPTPRWAIRPASRRRAAPRATAAFVRRRAGGLRALLRLAPDAGRRGSTCRSPAHRTSRRSCPTARPAPARPTSSSNISAACAAASGYDMGRWTPFVTGGIAWASTRFSRTDLTTGNEDAKPEQHPRWATCWAAASTTALDSRWSARAEYLYTNLGLTRLRLRLGAGALRFAIRPASLPRRPELQVRRDRRRDEEGDDDRGPGTWELHGQTTFIFQGYPPFRAPYSGPNSLPPSASSRETWTVSAFLGVRLLAGRRALLQSRAAAGLRRRQHHGRRAAIPTARRRSRTSLSRATTPRACSCARRSAWAASARRSRASTASSRARRTSRGSRCRSASTR